MGLLLMQFRKMHLLQEKNNIEYQLTDLNQKLLDYQSMSATLANDNVSLSDIASMPASLFGAGVDNLMMAHGAALNYADGVMQNMAAGGNSIFDAMGGNAEVMKQIAYMKAYEQGRKQIQKRQEAQLNEKEKEIQLKKTKLESREACIEEELKGISQKLPQQISESVSHYSLQGG